MLDYIKVEFLEYIGRWETQEYLTNGSSSILSKTQDMALSHADNIITSHYPSLTLEDLDQLFDGWDTLLRNKNLKIYLTTELPRTSEVGLYQARSFPKLMPHHWFVIMELNTKLPEVDLLSLIPF
jgi:hypothetical protein